MRTTFIVLAIFVIFATGAFAANSTRPIVLWHGMGDSCCNPISLGRLKTVLETALPGVYVYSIRIGDSDSQDSYNSFFYPVNKQLDLVCETLAQDPQLQDGFNAIGFSQGGQFLRAYVQRCNKPAVHNLISIGGQHQGVFGLPRCEGNSSTFCELMRKMLQSDPYISFVQDRLVQAQYWQDPFKEDEYLAKSQFLADANNARDSKNVTYARNLQTLNKFVMVMFENDTMVQPRESEWFGFYAPGQDKTVVSLQDSPLYAEDWLGLRAMDTRGQLAFLSTPGEHLQFTEQWFIDNIVHAYLTD